MPTLDELLAQCDQLIGGLPHPVQNIFDKAARAAKVPRSKLVAGFLILTALYMVFGAFAEFICNFVGFALPAYWSMGAIESSNKDDDTKWLTYWVVFAFFSCLDFFADGILSYFPFYWLFKVIFLAWCFAPVPDNGSNKIYQKVLRPYFIKNRAQIDRAMQKGAKVVDDLAKQD